MKKFVKVLALAMVLCVGVMLTACGGGEATLVMATNAQFPPYEYYEEGKIVGIDAEVAALIANKLGMKLEIEDMEFDAIINAVQAGKADIGMAGMTITEDRLENVNFTTSYTTATQVIIVKEGSAVQGYDDFDDITIGVQLGTTGDIYITDEKDDGLNIEVERYNKGFEAVQALAQDKIDAVIIDNEPAKAFVAQVDGLVILDEKYADEYYAIAIAKNKEDLLKKVDNALKELIESGEVQKIIDKYISAE